ncbi:hypothetical protein ACIQTX_08550 [Microbacterium sp. NPDC090281]|uniref:hypothetical protein n=1 Tax=Microbacterium sp. NPDC090281 TaxID=3364208 RepID=UPI003802B9A4
MLALSETPMPTPSMTVDPVSVTPGFVGFAAIVVVVIAVILLIWDMNRRIRRVRYREEVRDELDAEEAARAGGDTAAPEKGSPTSDGTAAPDVDGEKPAR